LSGRVDPVDPAFDRAAYRFTLGRVVLVDDDAADGAGAENDFRNLDAAAAERAVLYGRYFPSFTMRS
jgi:hypothetical protein